MKRLLLMSSSRKGSLGYLEHAHGQITQWAQGKVKKVLLIPYAAVTYGFDAYEDKVRPTYEKLGMEVTCIHRFSDAVKAVEKAEAIAVGGGNTFALLQRLYANKLVGAVHDAVENGLPYMGWSAGANVACPTIRTTNDMPVIEPPSLASFNLVPFQINPHFISGKPAGHNGESREERLAEFLAANTKESVFALREGSALLVENDQASLLGDLDALIFRQGGVTETLPVNGKFPLRHING